MVGQAGNDMSGQRKEVDSRSMVWYDRQINFNNYYYSAINHKNLFERKNYAEFINYTSLFKGGSKKDSAKTLGTSKNYRNP